MYMYVVYNIHVTCTGYTCMYMCMYLRVLACHPAHLLRVQLHGVVAQLGFGGGLQVLAAHGKIAVSLHPSVRENIIL